MKYKTEDKVLYRRIYETPETPEEEAQVWDGFFSKFTLEGRLKNWEEFAARFPGDQRAKDLLNDISIIRAAWKRGEFEWVAAGAMVEAAYTAHDLLTSLAVAATKSGRKVREGAKEGQSVRREAFDNRRDIWKQIAHLKSSSLSTRNLAAIIARETGDNVHTIRKWVAKWRRNEDI